MEIIKKYNELSKEQLQKDEIISNYNDNLNVCIDNLQKLKVSQNITTIILHPIKVIRNNRELKRLTAIRNDFKELYDANLVRFMEEESGNIDKDLQNAMNMTKPKVLKRFIKNNPIKNNPR